MTTARLFLLLAAFAMLAAALAPAALAQQPFKPKPSPMQEDVNKAVEKALGALKGMSPGGPYHKGATGDELLLYALFHAGVDKGDPAFQRLLKLVVDREPAHTYSASVAAMALAELDRAGYRWKLVHVAQFLCDNQCQNGQWTYGEPVFLDDPKVTLTKSGGPSVVASGPGGQGVRMANVPLYGTQALPPGFNRNNTQALPRVPVRKRRDGPPSGDNSNSQYAALGLRACAEAGIDVDSKVVKSALAWWEGAQNGDGGWGYGPAGEAWGSMTAGGVGAVVIYSWMLGKPWQRERTVTKGIDWINAGWDVAGNPRRGDGQWHGYYLYGLERVGMLYGSDAIGTHDWFDEGAKYLLANQKPDGSWQFTNERFLDTCFAVLFLRRATKSLPRVFTG